ncbi:hypothetical protein [Cronobacter muytjensii]|uniref:hypothetical protein n=1 Tax=Cronobacter muytjensii TaxID=413501 RepID=UPI0003A0039C|nr:hypothetical protein [Cronobacter muytjensii]ELY2494917.1 hypothetical protein [Cronobacter muytjensii]ELY3982505.1 hypothetical protein [Cronobacter muytjensii]ELY4662423.1 hypothetical protein [Cronobacter muytjensii]
MPADFLRALEKLFTAREKGASDNPDIWVTPSECKSGCVKNKRMPQRGGIRETAG